MLIKTNGCYGYEFAFKRMRNSYQSWDKSDSVFEPEFFLGPNDRKLALSLSKAGTSHATFMDHMIVQVDITAPRYWWQEMDRYSVGRARPMSESTVHTLTKRLLSKEDFSRQIFPRTLTGLNTLIRLYQTTHDRDIFLEVKANLPESFLQTRGMTLNYTTLKNIWTQRQNHPVAEWEAFLAWIKTLPYSTLITCGTDHD